LNTKLSTGPSSDAGKQTVSSNALDHGLASSKPAHVALPGEETALASHLDSYRKAYSPANQPEADLVRTLAESYWRLERAHKLENALFSQILQQDDYKDVDPTVAKSRGLERQRQRSPAHGSIRPTHPAHRRKDS
jgi:uncharacterized caspase-like protein